MKLVASLLSKCVITKNITVFCAPYFIAQSEKSITSHKKGRANFFARTFIFHLMHLLVNERTQKMVQYRDVFFHF